jgi:hypothetical protein
VSSWEVVLVGTGLVLQIMFFARVVCQESCRFDRILVVRRFCAQPVDFSLQSLLTTRKACAGVSAA